MYFPGIICYLFLIIILLTNCCQCQNEIRNAVKAKANRKINTGTANVRHVKDKTRGKLARADAKINRKHQNTKRKMHAIKTVIKS